MTLTKLLEQHRAWHLVLAALLLTISYLALSPAPPRGLDTGWDKLNHLLAFAALALAASFSRPAGQWRLAAAALLGYGALIEWLQSMTPNRQGEVADLLADLIGIAIGLALAALLRRLAAVKPAT